MGKKKGLKKYINKEFWGMTLTLFSAFSLLCVVTGEALLYTVGKAWRNMVLGIFGFAAFPILIICFLAGLMIIIGRKPTKGRGRFVALALAIVAFCVFSIVHLASFPVSGKTMSEYVSDAYTAAEGGFKTTTAGGALLSVILWLVVNIVSPIGAFIIFSLIIALCVLLLFKDKIFRKSEKDNKADEPVAEAGGERTPERASEPSYAPEHSYADRSVNYSFGNGGKRRPLVLGDDDFNMKSSSDYAASSAKEDFRRIFGEEKPTYYSEEYDRDFGKKEQYAKTPQYLKTDEPDYGGEPARQENRYEDFEERFSAEVESGEIIDDTTIKGNDYMPDTYTTRLNEDKEVASEPETEDFGYGNGENEKVVPGDEDGLKRRADFIKPQEKPQDNIGSVAKESKEVNPYDEMPANFRYVTPPTSIFNEYKNGENYEQLEYFKKAKATAIVDTLKSLAGIDVDVVNIVHGPTITRFDLDTPKDTSVKLIMKYSLDLNYRLAAKSGIRLLQIPGTPYTGIEVPNDNPSVVGLRSVLESDEFKNAKKDTLTFAVGQDIVGKPVVADITKMPHLLIGGSTGTGKSVGLNALIVSLMMKYSPAELRFIIVDPKQVEFTIFKGIPHMLFDEIIYDAKKTVAMLKWLVKEMEARFALMRAAEVRNIDEYNEQIDPRTEKKIPRLVVIIDEFADLMSVEKRAIQDNIQRIAQKARAAGIYLILATQRPDAKIIEGSIKTNFLSRIAYKMTNVTDSIVILGEAGAEKLLGRGDLLYKTSTMPNVERAQGAFVDTAEIKRFVKFINENNKCYYNVAAQKAIEEECNPTAVETVTGSNSDGAVTSDYIESLKIAVQMKVISIALLQRKMGFGFPKAAKIFDWMVDNGYVLGSQSGKQKQVVLTEEEFREKFGDI